VCECAVVKPSLHKKSGGGKRVSMCACECACDCVYICASVCYVCVMCVCVCVGVCVYVCVNLDGGGMGV
jgi:hypothetical protein